MSVHRSMSSTSLSGAFSGRSQRGRTVELQHDRLQMELRHVRRVKSGKFLSSGAPPALTQATLKDVSKTIPDSSYGSACPVEFLCGVESSSLPCSDSVVVMNIFGNSADVATRNIGASRSFNDGQPNKGEATAADGEMHLNLQTLEEAGWEFVEVPKVSTTLSTLQRPYFHFACEALGISFVVKAGESEERAMVTFQKSQMNRSAREVVAWIRKLKELDHANLVRLISACESVTEIYLLYEMPSGAGCLPMVLFSEQENLDVSDGARLLQQLSAGLCYAARHGCSHLDISFWAVMSANYDTPLPVKIWGVGLAGLMYTGKEKHLLRKESFKCRAPELCELWADPEIFLPLNKLDRQAKESADIFSIGVVSYAAFCGHAPFSGVDEEAVMRCIIENPPAFNADIMHIGSGGIELLESMLSRLPSRRPRSEQLVGNIWISMHSRQRENRAKIEKIVERLHSFHSMPPVMRAIATILSQNLRTEKVMVLQDSFSALDLFGDGELDANEVGEFLADSRNELKTLFKGLDQDGNGFISLKEFVLANVFGEDILTERVLMRTFEALDKDGSGDITPMELYRYLREVSPDLGPEAIAEFMGDVDQDWNASIDFTEFRSLFPSVQSRQGLLQQRVQRSKDLLELTSRLHAKFAKEVMLWRSSLFGELDRIRELRNLVSAESGASGCTKEWLGSVRNTLVKMLLLLKHTPDPDLKAGDETSYVECSELGKQNATTKKKSKKNDAELVVGGPMAFGTYFNINKKEWTKILQTMIDTARAMEHEQAKRRRTEVMVTVVELEEVFSSIKQQLGDLNFEQLAMFESAFNEESLPQLSFTMRGVPESELEDLVAASKIEAYRKQRKEKANIERLKEEVEQESQQQMLEIDSLAVRRGAIWANKRRKQLVKADPKTLNEAENSDGGCWEQLTLSRSRFGFFKCQ